MKSVNRVMIESAVKMARDVKAGIVLLCADVKKEFAELPEDVKNPSILFWSHRRMKTCRKCWQNT